jgi:hypothetical protein
MRSTAASPRVMVTSAAIREGFDMGGSILRWLIHGCLTSALQQRAPAEAAANPRSRTYLAAAEALGARLLQARVMPLPWSVSFARSVTQPAE